MLPQPEFRRAAPGLRVVAIIPARYESTRLPGKPLADLGGRPLIEHVYRRASRSQVVTGVLVATDSEPIAAAVRRFGGTAVMTRPTHRSGSDRLAEVAATLEADLIINVQGDEPLIEPAMIDEAVAPLVADATIPIGTVARRIADPADFGDPGVVKVVVDRDNFALYFSRAPIPCYRDGPASGGAPAVPPGGVLKHIGLYVYRRDALLTFATLPPTRLEGIEQLEQLRALEHGMRIKVTETAHDSIGVDTAADLDRVRALFAALTRG